jgi:rare lipoprotein A (peptidoglycan hydrolase)
VTRLRGAIVIVTVAIALLSFDTLSFATQPAPAARIDPAAFVRIVPPPVDDFTLAQEPAAPITDFAERRDLVAERAAAPDAPVGTVQKAPKNQGAAAPAVGSGHRVRGTATWYCKTGVSACTSGYPGGLYAAAGSELRVGNWRGRYVRVCTSSRCVTVKLIDWCACGGARIIDLYSDAFQRLGSLSQGGLQVTVTW